MSQLSSQIIELLIQHNSSIAIAESLTGGLVCADLTSVPGASAVVRGAIVAYATDIKTSVLGVDSILVADSGAVDATVALQMAQGVRQRLGAQIGLATTGVAGPETQDGQPVGTVFIACVFEDREVVEHLELPGTREEIRRLSVEKALQCVEKILS